MSSTATVPTLGGRQEAIACLGGVGFAFLAHHSIFIHGEWHIQAPQIIVIHSVVAAILALRDAITTDVTWVLFLEALSSAFYYGYLPGMLTSILVYRLVFHRLTRAGFPGPWYARPSKIWHLWAARKGQNHLVLDALHQKYGDIVRTGPSEVTVFTPDAFMVFDGPRSTCIKSEFYDLLNSLGYWSLVNVRDNDIHNARRREWQPGFSKASITKYETRVSPHIDSVVNLLREDAEQCIPSNIRDYMYWFSFDAMGEFVLSKSFNMLEKKEPSPIISRLQNALSLLGPLGPTPWLLHAGLKLAPRVSVIKDYFDTLDWCGSQMLSRLQGTDTTKAGTETEKRPAGACDLAHYLMEDGGKRNSEEKGRSWNMSWLTGDSLLAIVAGSDPTTTTLIGAFAEMAKHPEHAQKIYDEVATVDVNDFKVLATLPHLNGVIKETMRLYPSILSGGTRKTQSEPVVIGGHIIPPYTTIAAPRYTINRREDCYEQPLDFIPERWTSRPEMVKDKSGYTPFGTGSRACLGRFLAEEIMRGVLARSVKMFSFTLAPGETGNRVMEQVKDQFVPNPGPLSLCFERR